MVGLLRVVGFLMFMGGMYVVGCDSYWLVHGDVRETVLFRVMSLTDKLGGKHFMSYVYWTLPLTMGLLMMVVPMRRRRRLGR